METRLLTARGASELLGLPVFRVYELQRLGALPAVRVGNRTLRFDVADMHVGSAHIFFRNLGRSAPKVPDLMRSKLLIPLER